ncbi:MAG: hypothetical protein U0176_26715 [Bacteroidia bacterium]
MKRLRFILPTLLLTALIATSCADKTVKVYMANVPVYTETATWRAQAINFEAPRDLKNPGKIYLYENLLIVNDFLQGVHIFDNTNPAAPANLGFLPVLANQDIAVRNDIMYLDSYTDLVAFDISNPSQPHLVGRVNDVFEFNNHGYLPGYNSAYPMVEIDPTQGVVTGWTLEKTQDEVLANRGMLESFAGPMIDGGGLIATSNFASGIGMAGSTARFAIVDHILYTIESWQLGVFDIQEGMVHTKDLALTRMAETAFPAEGYLYIGTTSGMLIYDVHDPSNPTYVSEYAHFTACDPVVVQGNRAFVTLSTGRNCGGSVNALEVINISDMTMPYLEFQFNMTNPKGLGLDGNTLFLCDGVDGLKVYDKTDLSTIPQHLISQFQGITTADVIPTNQVLVMTAEEGIYQYSYADLQHISQLSLIPAHH